MSSYMYKYFLFVYISHKVPNVVKPIDSLCTFFVLGVKRVDFHSTRYQSGIVAAERQD